MKTLDFMNNNIIPLGNNNDEEKYKILLINVRWTANNSFATSNPIVSDRIFNSGVDYEKIFTEEEHGRGKLARGRIKKNEGKDNMHFVNVGVDFNATEHRGAGGIHKLFGRAYNNEKFYGPWSSGNWIDKDTSTADYFDIYLFKPGSVRLYKEGTQPEEKASYAAGLITFELVKVRIEGKNITPKGRSIQPRFSLKESHKRNMNIHGTKAAISHGWISKKGGWSKQEDGKYIYQLDEPRLELKHLGINEETGEVDENIDKNDLLTRFELEKRNRYGLIAYFGDCKRVSGTNNDEAFDCNYSSTDDDDWYNFKMKTENFSREHVDIAKKSIYENFSTIFDSTKTNNEYPRIRVNFADWYYDDTVDESVGKWLEDKSAGKALRVVTASELKDTRNKPHKYNDQIAAPMPESNAPYFISTYDKSKIKKKQNQNRGEAGYELEKARLRYNKSKIITSAVNADYSGGSNSEGFNNEVTNIKDDIEEKLFKSIDKKKVHFLILRIYFQIRKESFVSNEETEEEILEKMRKGYNSLKNRSPARFKEYNEAALDYMMKQYKFRADYEVSEDFGITNKKDGAGELNSGYDRQDWKMEIYRIDTHIDERMNAFKVADSRGHGLAFKFGFLNPVFFDGDQRSRGACFGKNTKIKLKSGKKINIQNLKYGDILFNDAKVTATAKHLYTDQNIYKVNDIIITENHGVIYENKIIPAYYYPNAKIQKEYKYTYLYCFSTDTKRLVINDITFCDWDEVSDKEINYLASIGKINKKIQHSFIHQQFDSGFIPSTMIELNNGKNIKIEDLKIGDILKNEISVLGIIKIDIDNVKLNKHYIFNKPFYGTKNLVYAIKNNYSKEKLKHVSTYFQHDEKYIRLVT